MPTPSNFSYETSIKDDVIEFLDDEAIVSLDGEVNVDAALRRNREALGESLKNAFSLDKFRSEEFTFGVGMAGVAGAFLGFPLLAIPVIYAGTAVAEVADIALLPFKLAKDAADLAFWSVCKGLTD